MPRGRRVSNSTANFETANSPSIETVDWSPILAKRLADSRSYRAGEQYYASKAVRQFVVDDDEITAIVHGSQDYAVTLSRLDEEEYSCSCPWNIESGEFCKHCVATVLAYHHSKVNGSSSAESGKAAKKGRRPAMENLRDWLKTLPVEQLVDLICEQAQADSEWKARLVFRMEADSDATDPTTLKKMIDGVTRASGYLGYRETRGFVEKAEEVFPLFQNLMSRGQAGLAAEMALYTIERLQKAQSEADDSNGHIDGLMQRVAGIHLEASLVIKPEPLGFARQLLNWELEGYAEVWSEARERYAEVLGEQGKQEYKRLLIRELDKIPVRKVAEVRRTIGMENIRERRVRSLAENLARLEDDFDLLIRTLSIDLTSSYSYLSVAFAYKERKRDDEALAWAERGMSAFPEDYMQRIGDFLVEEYRQRGAHDKALVILWKRFERCMDRPRFQELQEYTKPIGEWPSWRERALTTLQQSIEDVKSKKTKLDSRNKPYLIAGMLDGTPLVDVYLYEKQLDLAWEAVAEYGCSRAVLLQLAKGSEKTHGEQAVAVYRHLLPTMIEQSSGDYSEPADLIQRIGKVLRSEGDEESFLEYVAELKTNFKRKRNFMAELAKRKL